MLVSGSVCWQGFSDDWLVVDFRFFWLWLAMYVGNVFLPIPRETEDVKLLIFKHSVHIYLRKLPAHRIFSEGDATSFCWSSLCPTIFWALDQFLCFEPQMLLATNLRRPLTSILMLAPTLVMLPATQGVENKFKMKKLRQERPEFGASNDFVGWWELGRLENSLQVLPWVLLHFFVTSVYMIWFYGWMKGHLGKLPQIHHPCDLDVEIFWIQHQSWVCTIW